MEKFEKGRDFDWDDLSQLVRKTAAVDREKITADCIGGYRFLVDLTEEEFQLANDSYQRKRTLWQKLRMDVIHQHQKDRKFKPCQRFSPRGEKC